MAADAEKPSAILPQGSTAIEGKKVYAPVAMSSPPTLPWSATVRDARLLVLILTQCAVTWPASVPLAGRTSKVVQSALSRQTAFRARRSLVLMVWAEPS